MKLDAQKLSIESSDRKTLQADFKVCLFRFLACSVFGLLRNLLMQSSACVFKSNVTFLLLVDSSKNQCHEVFATWVLGFL